MVKEKRHSIAFGALACFAIVLTMAGCSRQLPPGERNNFHAFGVEHASLHSEYFGETRGTEDFYEDSSGLHEAHVIHSEFITEKKFRPEISYTVREESHVTAVNSVKTVEIRFIDKMYDSLFHLPFSDVPTPDGQFASFVKERGYVLHGDTTISASGINLKSNIWQLGEQQTYLFEFKGLIVGKISTVDDHVSYLRLMSIDTTTPIDPARFQVPHGFPVMDRTKSRTNAPGIQP